MDELIEVKGKQTGDYFKFYCGKCKSHLNVTHTAIDQAVQKLKFNCPECKKEAELKVHNLSIKK